MDNERGEKRTAILDVYVPVPDSTVFKAVAKGSALVGGLGENDQEGDRIVIDYEGGVFGQFKSYGEKAIHAAGRHTVRYPTVARMWVPTSEVIRIGSIDTREMQLRIEVEPSVYAHWLDPLEAADLTLPGPEELRRIRRPGDYTFRVEGP